MPILQAVLIAAISVATLASTDTAPGHEIAAISRNPPCDVLLQAGLGDRIVFPSDPAYLPQIDTWWALNTRFTPWCLFMPQTTPEVAKGLSALHRSGSGAGDWHIAVRSGGHNSAGGSNIQNGVTIDLSMMNQSTYDPATKIASVQSGARWKQVYTDLLKFNVTVAGGRDGGVGVGGFLLGGGLTFYMGRRGFACDSVSAYEVVLANGTIVIADQDHHADLWKALRGGGGNFGIVTRFDMEALPGNNISYTTKTMAFDQSERALNNLADFTNLSENQAANDALVLYYTYNRSEAPELVISVLAANTAGDPNSSALQPIKSIPAIVESSRLESMAASANSSQLAGGTRNAGMTLTFRLDLPTMRHAVATHNKFVSRVSSLVGPNYFSTFLFLQPLPSSYIAVGDRGGGNMLSRELADANAIMWTAGVALNPNTQPAHLAVAHQYLSEMAANMKEYARARGADLEFVYMNYADAAQDPLGTYGPSNVEFLKRIAREYDPQGWWQTMVPGGFKISRSA